jgi:hypothetical protein
MCHQFLVNHGKTLWETNFNNNPNTHSMKKPTECKSVCIPRMSAWHFNVRGLRLMSHLEMPCLFHHVFLYLLETFIIPISCNVPTPINKHISLRLVMYGETLYHSLPFKQPRIFVCLNKEQCNGVLWEAVIYFCTIY